MIDILDNQITSKEEIYKELLTLDFYYGETDMPDKPPTGMISNLNKTQFTFQTINKFCEQQDCLKELKLDRAYVNIFSPREHAFFHWDDAVKTVIYYPNLDWNINEGGETKFVSDNNTLLSVLPVPGRIIIFDSKIWHCATSFQNSHRFSVVFKFI